jgi:hypothetical protein
MLLTPPLGEEQFPVPLPSVPVGGRLTQFLHHWEKFTTYVGPEALGTNVFLLLSIPVGAEDETEAEPSVKINQKPYQKEENEVRSPEEFH